MRWYRLPLNPEPWAIGSVQVGRRQGHLSGTVGRNQQLFNYQEAVREELRLQSPEPLEGDIRLKFYFWRQVASYRTDNDRLAYKGHADTTNLQKATEDALQGVLFANDRAVVQCASRIIAQGPSVEPLVLVGIEVAPPYEIEDLPEEALRLFLQEDELPFEDDSATWNVGEAPF